MQSKKLSRRDFLRLSALSAVGTALAGCCPTYEPVVREIVVTVETEREVEKETVITQVVREGVEVVEVRWFIGLGTGGKPEQIELEDWRLMLGMRMEQFGLTAFIEGGWGFGRNVDFLKGIPGFDITSGFLGRIGLRY